MNYLLDGCRWKSKFDHRINKPIVTPVLIVKAFKPAKLIQVRIQIKYI